MEYDPNYPIYLQIVNEIKRMIIIGKLAPGCRLPSNSDLSIQFKINPNTVQRIYKQLECENICFTKRGLGTFISEDKNLPARLRTEAVTGMTKTFLSKMSSLGLSSEEIINVIKDIDRTNKYGDN